MLLLFCVFFFVVISSALAQELGSTVSDMEPVVVVGTIESTPTGKTILDSDQLSTIPRRNGSINEALTVAPGVQFSETVNNSFTAGEITPPDISISGASIYQNNFQIDGINNNNQLDPANSSTISGLFVPQQTQLVFISPQQVDRVTVYDNNVPAKYSGFNGGVVNVETKKPDPGKFSGYLTYRTTRDAWTNFHIADSLEYSFYGSDYDEFVNSDSEAMQPNFTKHDASVSLNIPLSDNAALLSTYSRLWSEIPLYYFGAKRTQTRQSENYSLKYGVQLSGEDHLSVGAIYAPYSSELFRSSGYTDYLYDELGNKIPNPFSGKISKVGYPMQVKDSDYIVESDALQIIADFSHTGTLAQFQLKTAYLKNENARLAPQHFYRWYSSQPDLLDPAISVATSKDWGFLYGWPYSDEGHLGDISTRQETWQIKGDLLVKEDGIPGVSINAGFDYQYIIGSYNRPETSYEYTSPLLDPAVVCPAGDIACVSNEQFLRRRSIYSAVDFTTSMRLLGLYTEAGLKTGRLKFDLGLRLDIDDYMENKNLAPRFAASYDISGDGSTVLLGGWNRYYDTPMLAYSLREGMSPYATAQFRPTAADWDTVAITGHRYYNYSELETPYADEAVAGIQQSFLAGKIDTRYIYRDFKNQFSYTYSKPDRMLNNFGKREYQSVRFSWERYWDKQYLNINATWEETESNFADYSTNIDDDETLKQIYYIATDIDSYDTLQEIYGSGKLLYTYELPPDDFNRPWVANLTFSTELPYGFKFTNVAKYRSGYEDLAVLSYPEVGANKILKDSDGDFVKDSQGNIIYIYEKVKRGGSTVFDWMLEWTSPQFSSHQELKFRLEVFNVFDKRNVIAEGDSDSDRSLEFELGRQFWLGAEYHF